MDFDFSDILELDVNVLTWSIVLYLFCMIVLWRFGEAFGAIPLSTKVITTIAMLPITYILVSIQANR